MILAIMYWVAVFIGIVGLVGLWICFVDLCFEILHKLHEPYDDSQDDERR